MRIAKKQARRLTVADIVSPGDILGLARSTLSKVATLDGLVVVALGRDGTIQAEYAGLDDAFGAVGLLEAGKLAFLEEDDE